MIRCLMFLALLLSLNANAQYINISTLGNITGDLGQANGLPSSFSVTHTGSGTFTDIYEFILANPGTDIGILGIYEGVSPISLSITGSGSGGLGFAYAESKTDWNTLEQYWIFVGQLNGGSYGFNIVGNADGTPNPFIPASVTYVFTAGVSPVPEPSTYALMAMGLAFLGYIAMRQARNTQRVLRRGCTLLHPSCWWRRTGQASSPFF
jgi:hypothetical protein